MAHQSVRLNPRGSPATSTVDGAANRGCTPAVTVVLRRDTPSRGVLRHHLSGGWECLFPPLSSIRWGLPPPPPPPAVPSRNRIAAKKQALGKQDPAGKVWLSVEEVINLWKLENSGKEETPEPAAPPLLCRRAARGAISRAGPVLGSTSDAVGIPCHGLGALLGLRWIFEGAGKMEEMLFLSRGCFLFGFWGVCLWVGLGFFNLKAYKSAGRGRQQNENLKHSGVRESARL